MVFTPVFGTSAARIAEAKDGKRAATRHDALGKAREPNGRHARMRAHTIGSRKTVTAHYTHPSCSSGYSA